MMVLFGLVLAFPVVTAFFWPWWDSPWGRNIVSLEILIAVALLQGVLEFTHIAIDPYMLAWIGIASVWLISIVIIWRAVLVWRAQRTELPDEDGPYATDQVTR